MSVNWAEIDRKWQQEWDRAKIFQADPDPKRQKCLVTYPFPYMSGPLHVGNGFTAARIDVYARYMRMRGYNVLFPWAWHWTGKTVAGAAERIKNGDEEFIRPIREVDEVPEEDLRKFVDPVYMAKYYTDVNRKAIQHFGISVDWRREFHTSSLNPAFSKFITWQYLRLREKGYVITGTHPVVWCPKDQSPTGDADRMAEGVGVRPEEFILVKFKMEGLFLPCATFRPETIYGVTNLWVNPEGEYVEANVNGERWVVSKTAAGKLQNQLKDVKIVRDLRGSELVGKNCSDLIQNRQMPILPGSFVNTGNATGLVYSVPAHAPFDWLALRDVQQNPALTEKFGIKQNDLTQIKPISVITVEGYGEFPALEIVDRMHIRDQNDPLAEEATKEIYKAEFHGGILRDNCGPYSKQKVSDVKDGLVADFRRKGIADVMYELPKPVICRCMTPCVAKVLQDQWFLKYSDPDWKVLAHQAIDGMAFYPEEAKAWFHGIIDWLQDWPCARRTGLGTPLPWSPSWIVETLSDSTIYMAYYMVSKFVNGGLVKAEQLTPEVFDYIFYGVGKPEDVCKAARIDRELLDDVRNEFLYWYPVDLRNSGKDLVGNHLSFFIFHHVALFEKKYWPKGIGVNGFMLLEGRPIHKSSGNFVPLWKACEQFGADAVRCNVLLAAEGMDDPDWRADNIRDVKNRLESFLYLVDDVAQRPEQHASNGHLEGWLMSKISARARLVGEAVEKMKTRTATSVALYDLWNDLRWYERRASKPDSATLRAFIADWIRLLAPFSSHMAEEAWRKAGQEGFVAAAEWPKTEQVKADASSDELESLIRQTLEDTQEIIATTKLTPKKVHYYTAAKWKWRVYNEAMARFTKQPETLNGLIRDLLAAKTASVKDLPKYASKIIQQVRTMPNELRARRLEVGEVDERRLFADAQPFFSKELKTEVEVHSEEDGQLYDPKGRAKMAEPYRPAIFLE
ncbi:MAG TPA: leucine--tRNA ligase [Candidatus Acidoferrales bacterium]|nr:leucine--tRNA ligase [Candidatus Acidoferrales bacterium]